MFTNIKKFINNSFFMDNIDRIAFFVLLILLFAAISSSSDLMGLLALLFSGLMIFKTIFSNEKIDLSFKPFQKALLIYFLIVSVSLFASSLFKLSLHGYIKTLIYILFFYSSCIFFKKNSSKIPAIILFVAGLMSYESMVAIVQNMGGVVEISGWQDMTNINPEQVVSRAYGTLQPYNPNLLAGYLLCGLSSLVYLVLVNLKQGKKRIPPRILLQYIIMRKGKAAPTSKSIAMLPARDTIYHLTFRQVESFSDTIIFPPICTNFSGRKR